jgi:hypothetical protein
MGNVHSKQKCTLPAGGVAVAGPDGVFVVKASSCCCSSSLCYGGEMTLFRGDSSARLQRRRGHRTKQMKTPLEDKFVKEFENNGILLEKKHGKRTTTKREVLSICDPPGRPMPAAERLKKEALLAALVAQLQRL